MANSPKLDKNTRYTLNNGVQMPVIGLGVWKSRPGKQTRQAVLWALETGYRLIDTARLYLNERSVGRAVRESGVKRQDVFVTTKLWNNDQGYDSALHAFDKSLKRLGLDYVDLYLIHWPVPGKRLESWRALEEIYRSGRARAIGVSNFTIAHLKELLDQSDTVPAVNQVEFHPWLYQKELLQFCRQQKIQLESYSPLVRGEKAGDATMVEIAEAHGKSEAQVMLRWNLQHGSIAIPKSVHRERIYENIDIFNFELSDGEMSRIDSLGDELRVTWDPSKLS